MNKFLLVLAFSIIAYSGECQYLGFALTQGQKVARIPFELNNNLIVIPVVVNGMLPLKFILDTGVRSTILTDKTLSDLLNLTYTRKYTIAGAGGGKTAEAFITNNVSLDLPGIHGLGHTLLVLAEDYLELPSYLGTEVHGILGYELFSRFVIKIDYVHKILTVMTPEEFKPKSKYQKIPIRIEDTKPYITGEVVQMEETRITAKLLIDTGASHALMLESTSDARIKLPTNYISNTIGRGLGGIIMGKVGRIESLTLGKFKSEYPIVSFPDPNSYIDSLKMGSVFRNGSVGGEMLSRFTIIFDYPNEYVYLKKNNLFRRPFHFNLSGLTIKAIGAHLNGFEIVEVRSQSVGDKAGFLPGDVILSLNNISAADLKLRDIIGFFNYKSGKLIMVDVQRGGKKIKKKFKLRDQI